MKNLKDICFAIWVVASLLVVQQAAQPRLRSVDLNTGEAWYQPIDPKTKEYAVEYNDGDDTTSVKAKLDLKRFAPPLKIVDAKGKVVAQGAKR